MPVTLCVGNRGNESTGPSLSVQDSAVIVCKANQDLKNVENIIPLVNSGSQEDTGRSDGVQPQCKSLVKPSTITNFPTSHGMMYGLSKNKKAFGSNNSSTTTTSTHRKKQSHQEVMRKLKDLHFNLVPSGLDRSDDIIGTDITDSAGNMPIPFPTPEQKKDFNTQMSSCCNGVESKGVVICEDKETLAKKKSLQESKCDRNREEETNRLLQHPGHYATSRKSVEGINEQPASFANGAKEPLLRAAEAGGVTDGCTRERTDPGFTHSVHNFIESLSQRSATGTTATASERIQSSDGHTTPAAFAASDSQPHTSHGTRGNHHKAHHHGKGGGSTKSTNHNSNGPATEPISQSVSGVKKANEVEMAHSGKMHSPASHGLAQQKETHRSDHFKGAKNIPSSASQNARPNPTQHQPYLHHLSGHHKHQPLLQEPHHTLLQTNGTHQYSLDFLCDVGMKMSLVGGGNVSGSVASMLRGSHHTNYNFSQQFQQPLIQHHQLPPQHHTIEQSPSRTQSHPQMMQQHQPHQLQQLQQQHHPQQPQQQQQQQPPHHHQQQLHYHHRVQHAAYRGENLVSSHATMGLTDHGAYGNHAAISNGDLQILNGCNGSNSEVGSNVKEYEATSYAYVQHENDQHAHHYQNHHQSHHHPHHQQQQQLHNYHHQNNNYQHYNRNINGRSIHMNYYVQNGTAATGSREDSHRRKAWNGHGNGPKAKGSAAVSSSGKQFSKGQGAGHTYRKNYHHYQNNPVAGGHQYYDQMQMQPQHHHHHHHHHQQQPQHHYYKQHNMYRNLVYLRGYDQGLGDVPPTESNAEDHQKIEKPSSNHIVSSDDKTKECMVPENTEDQIAGVDELARADMEEERASGQIQRSNDEDCVSNQFCTVPRSSSSSSVVSIPSTESSVISSHSATSQMHAPLEASSNGTNGHDYESDSSHSSDYQDGSYRTYNEFNQTNDERTVYRSSSTTSSGISSSATCPASSEFIPSSPVSLHSRQLVGDFFGRCVSYHGSHQNLTVYCGSEAVGDRSSPIDSPTDESRPVMGTQSVPIFGELFCSTNQQQHLNGILSAAGFGSSTSLDQAAFPSVTYSSSSSSSLSAASVPPTDFVSMQSGHPKKRQSGRSSPCNGIPQSRVATSRSTLGTSNSASSSVVTKAHHHHHHQQQQQTSGGRKNNQVSLSYTHRSSLPSDFQFTPADRYILRANEVEMKEPPVQLGDGGKWDSLSRDMWKKFTAAQQTEEMYIAKMELWRYLYICIRKGFPKYGLYLVGSTISGFGANSSDVDMCLVARSGPSYCDPRTEALYNLSLVKDYFMNMPSTSFEQFSLIQAKVPILRFQDSKHGIEVDLNFNNCVGIRNTHLLNCYSQMDWRVRPLVLVVKLWAQHHNINDAKNMTISSYSLVLMVIHFLQYGVSVPVLPCLHALYPEKFMKIIDINSIEMIERIEPYQTENKETLGELLMHFLEYYTHFDYARFAISVRTASVIPIEECRLARSYKNDPHHWKHLCIEEPFDLTNTARSVFDGEVFEQIKSTFAVSMRMLKEHKNLSVLFGDPLFTPVTSTLSITS
ncbi:filaggrin-like isoform X2 [Anopheles aquasalis]|uniref:filaggrin-like isoform X2 n=1 Tax=Anopheles aquasalis TaxID=42839 RepID=UPI00215A87F2|nr:filaggrin-like isoform X2 [Anopheles aquasalis]